MTVMYKLALLASVALAVSAAPVSTPARHSTAVDLSIANLAQASTLSSNFVSKSASGGGEFSGRGTWFTGSSGSCEVPFGADDLIVAMNAEQMDGTSQCGKSVQISFGGKTVTAKVADTCPSQFCSSGALDLSPAVFQQLAPLSVGVIDINWQFV